MTATASKPATLINTLRSAPVRLARRLFRGRAPAKLKLTDPLVNAGFAVCFIGLPQLTLTYKIFTVGGEGMAGLMLLAGHIGILTRLGQLWFAIKEAGWERDRQGAALGELANEGTWLLVTLAWLVS